MVHHLFYHPHMIRRLIALVLSTCLMGVGVAIFNQLGFGTDPCSVLNLAISRLIGWSFGNWQLTMNVILLLLLILLGEIRRIGLGSVANMVLVGYAADAATWVLNRVHPLYGETFLVKLAVFAPTMLLFLIAVAFYMVVDLGTAPYDAIPMVIADRQRRLPFSAVRMLWDLSILTLGFLCGGVVGLVTLVTGFCLGPLYGAIAKRIRPLFE